MVNKYRNDYYFWFNVVSALQMSVPVISESAYFYLKLTRLRSSHVSLLSLRSQKLIIQLIRDVDKFWQKLQLLFTRPAILSLTDDDELN